jgi:glycosyltransferase involved in cell wall biosynthesis
LNLRSEIEIISSWSKYLTDVKVSICILVYNQEQFITDTIDGVLNQITDFPIEIIIHDDNSQDSSKEIILNYAQKYPTIIKPIIQSVNQHSISGYRVTNSAFRIACGEYIAWCDGDDYWTLDTKLQQQVHLLEDSNADLCYTDLDILSNSNVKVKIFENNTFPNSNNINEFIINGYFKGPCTWLWKKHLLQSIPENKVVSTDISFYVMAYFMNYHKVVYLPVSTSVYRVLSNSMTHTRSLRKHYNREYKLFELQNLLINEFNLDCEKSLHRMKFVKFFFMELVLNKECFLNFLKVNNEIINSFKPETKREKLIYCVQIWPNFFKIFVKLYFRCIGYKLTD